MVDQEKWGLSRELFAEQYQMKLQQRKVNRIPNYDYSTQGAYFVTICTQGREALLSDMVGDGFPVLKPIGLIAQKIICQLSEKYPEATVDQYVIMPDHIHLLIRIVSGTGNPSPTLGSIIGWYKYQVTKLANMQMNTAGQKLFQRSYYDHVIRGQQDYDEVWQYIENNPIKWAIQRRGYE